MYTVSAIILQSCSLQETGEVGRLGKEVGGHKLSQENPWVGWTKEFLEETEPRSGDLRENCAKMSYIETE